MKGKRIMCVESTDIYSPLPTGSLGTVIIVDDMGTIHVKWDNGRSLGLVPGEDRFKILD